MPLDTLKEYGQGASKVLGGPKRPPPVVLSAEPVFINGEDLSTPAGGPATLRGAPGATGNAMSMGRRIEIVHFGTVYRDRAGGFPHPEADDMDPGIMGSSLQGRALAFRAALQREAILLSGLIGGLVVAIEEEHQGNEPGEESFGLGALLGTLGDMMGSPGGGSSRPDGTDLNPYLQRIFAAAATVNQREVSYEALHEAGVELHTVRAGMRAWIAKQCESLREPGPSGPSALDAAFGSDLIPDGIKDFVGLLSKIALKPLDVFLLLVFEMTLRMQPAMELACREATIAAIRRRNAPVFDIWFPPPPPDAAPVAAESAPEKTGLGFVDDAVAAADKAKKDAEKKVDEVKDTVDDAVDFLNRPPRRVPGGRFVDQAFQMTDPAPAPSPGSAAEANASRAPARAESLGALVVESLVAALDMDLPTFVTWPAERMAEIDADFARAVWGQLTQIESGEKFQREELIAAGRYHLTDMLVETLLGMLGFLDDVRNLGFRVQGMNLSLDRIFQEAKERLLDGIGPKLDPIVDEAMGGLADAVLGARDASSPGRCMEAYFAVLPLALARLFRTTFFPIWGLVVKPLYEAIGKLLDPLGGAIGAAAGAAKAFVDEVVAIVEGIEKAIDALKDGIELSAGGLDDKGLLDAFDREDDEEEAPAGPFAAFFPFQTRERMAAAKGIAPAELDRVAERSKWQQEPSASAAS